MKDYRFGNFVYKLRAEKNLSQSELGKLVGVSNKAVSKWENGGAKPSPDTLRQLAEVLGVTVEELLAGERMGEKTSNDGFSTLEKETADIRRRITAHYTRVVLINLAAFGIYIAYIFSYFYSFIGLLIVMGVMFLLERKVMNMMWDKYINSILYKELDPHKYASVLLSLPSNMMARTEAAFHMGDYQNVINVCNKQIKTEKNVFNKLYYYNMLSNVYFLFEEYDKLKLVCKEVEIFCASTRKLNRKIPPIYTFYRLFMNEEYEKCLEYYDNAVRTENEKNMLHNATVLRLNYNKAVVLKRMGRLAESKEMFELVIAFAPKMHMSVLAKKHIEDDFEPIKLVADGDFEVNDKWAIRAKIGRIAIAVLLALLLIYKLVAGYLEWQYYSEFGDLNEQLMRYDPEYRMLELFPVGKTEDDAELVCIAEENGKIDVLVCLEYGRKCVFVIIYDDMTPESGRVSAQMLDGTSVLMQVSYNAEDIYGKIYTDIFAIEINGKEAYFGIAY